jgi:hypothetical protein
LFQPGLGRHSPPSVIVIWLFRLLVFKLMFFSMVVKLATGEAGQWVTLRAMDYHYWTQPIPNPLSWYFAKLPRIVHETEVILTLIIEGVAPFGIFGPRLARRSAFVAMASLMVMIMLTGNYTFFNLLAIVLFTSILDDNDWNPW